MRRFNFLPILLLTLGLAAPAVGQGNRSNDDWWDADEWGPAYWTSDFDRLDRNDNGYISQNEWNGNERVFARVDRNDDRRLSRAEVRRWDDNREARLAERFRENDDNRDHRLSSREWWGNDLAFERMDINGDHYLTWREVKERREITTGDRAFSNLDRNRDGRLNRDEWSGNRRDFDRLDRNDDGWVTAGEWRRS